MTGRKKKTTVGVPLDNKLLKKLDLFAEASKIDRRTVIRNALQDYVEAAKDALVDYAVKGYVQGKLEKKEFLEISQFESVPENVEDAREKFLLRKK
ncbi:MAG: hypothetical protein V1820_02525 [archaeon]